MGQGAEDLEDWELRQSLGGSYDRSTQPAAKGKQMADTENQSGALTAFMKKGGAVALSKEQRAAALRQAADEGSTGDSDVIYLTFSGQGGNYTGWKMGRNGDKPDPESLFVIDPSSIIKGWIIWKGGNPAFKHEWSAFDPAAAMTAAQLPDHGPYADGDGPSFQMGMSMFDTDDPSKQIKFTTSSTSGRNAVSDLLSEIADRIEGDEPEVPVLYLDSEPFTAQGKKNGKPKFVIDGWVTPEEVHAFIGMGDDADVETLLNGGYAGDIAAAEPEPEPVPEPEERPKRARRTRSAA